MRLAIASSFLLVAFACTPPPSGRDDPDDEPDGGVDADAGVDDPDGGVVEPDGGVVERIAPTLRTGALDETTICAGSEVNIPFTLSDGDGDDYSIVAEISDAVGSFANPIEVGGIFSSIDGVVVATLPNSLPGGDGYRVRVVIENPLVVADDNGTDLQVGSAPQLDLRLTPQRVLVGDTVRFADQSTNAVSRLWTFEDADASLTSSTDAVVDVTFNAEGIKTIRFEATSADGCVASEIFDDAFDGLVVHSCQPAIPANAEVLVDDVGRVVGGSPNQWMCGGSATSFFGGGGTYFVEPGATATFEGGGFKTIFVKAGGRFIGGSGGTAAVILEPGAIVTNHSNQITLNCDELEFNVDDAPVDGCIPAGTNPDNVTITVGTIGGAQCPEAPITVPVTVDGLLGPTNQFIFQLSDPNGSFANPRTIGIVGGDSSDDYDAVLPPALPAGLGYRVRAISSHPPTLGPPSAPFEVVNAAVARITVTQRKSIVGQDVTFENASDAHLSSAWNFGADGVPSTAETENGTTAFQSPGFKDISLTITDTNGCSSTAVVTRDPNVFNSGFEALGCEFTIASDVVVHGPGAAGGTNGNGQHWVCGGSRLNIFGGSGQTLVEEQGALNFDGGGQQIFYVRAGAHFDGAAGGANTVVSEPGAFITNVSNVQNVLTCPSITVDLSDAPANACEAFVAPTPSIAIADPESVAFCVDDLIEIPTTIEGVFDFSNGFKMEISDAEGDFAATPPVIGTQFDLSEPRFFGRLRNLNTGEGYRVRVTRATPALVSNTTSAFSVQETPDIDLEFPFYAEVGVPVTGVNDTVSTATWTWVLDDTLLSTDITPTFTFLEHGVQSIDVTATTSAGCADTTNVTIATYSCSPPIGPDAVIINGDLEVFGGSRDNWVCDGGNFDVGAGGHRIFVESGGNVTTDSGGIFTVYVKAGGTYTGNTSGLRAVISEPGAILNLSGRETLLVECPVLTFDETFAPPNGCD